MYLIQKKVNIIIQLIKEFHSVIENLSSIFRQFGCSCLEDYLMITHNATCKNYLTDTNLNDTAIDKFI